MGVGIEGVGEMTVGGGEVEIYFGSWEREESGGRALI